MKLSKTATKLLLSLDNVSFQHIRDVNALKELHYHGLVEDRCGTINIAHLNASGWVHTRLTSDGIELKKQFANFNKL